MTDAQLYLAIGVPIVSNAVMLLIFSTMVNARISALEAAINSRLSSVETRLDLLIGKVMEFDGRLARLEERGDRRT
jgi:hypothetical protein